MDPPLQRVLSIQSHVVSGYVGNKAAVFPLQLLGFDVDVINSVHFSNHTGHPHGFTGDVLNGDQLRSILKGLKQNGLLENVGHLLTGYIGSESFLNAVLDVWHTLKQTNPNQQVRFVCDPVLGDHGKLYVPPQLVSLYRDKVIPQADAVTPNQFEVEQLTGITIQSQGDALRACRALHDLGPSLVVITSMVLKIDDVDTDTGNIGSTGKIPSMTAIASQRTNNSEQHQDEVWRIDSKIIPGNYTGTGDLCAALLLGHTAMDHNNLSLVLEKVTNTMFSVIARTAETGGESVALRELKLIQSKRDIEQPPQLYKAFKVQ